MWVLHICHSYYPPFLDCARQYATLFKGTSYQVLTVYLTGKYDEQVVIGSESDEVLFLGYDSKAVSGLKIGAILKIKALVKQKDFAFCISHRVKPTYVALLATNLPVISLHHNYNDYSRWSRRFIVNFYQDRLFMLGVSNSVRDDLRHDLRGWSAGRIQTLYNRIDIETVQAKLLTKTSARGQLSLSEDAWILGAAGRLHHDKDYHTLLRGFALALSKLPALSLLVIMGKGPLEAELKELAQLLGITSQVKFLGHVSNGATYFKAFDTFALTSNHEPFGMVLLEAMAAEVPIICSDCGGGAEVVRGTGELFELGNPAALSGCIVLAAYKNDKLRNLHALQKLKDNFSDEAAKKRFGKLIPLMAL